MQNLWPSWQDASIDFVGGDNGSKLVSSLLMRNVSGIPRDLKECAIRPWHWLCRDYLTSYRHHHHHRQRLGDCSMHGIDPTISSALEVPLIIRNGGCVTGVAYCAKSVEGWVRNRLVVYGVAPRVWVEFCRRHKALRLCGLDTQAACFLPLSPGQS
jgi:hypothetical protein